MDVLTTNILRDILQRVRALPELDEALDMPVYGAFEEAAVAGDVSNNPPEVADELSEYLSELIDMLVSTVGCDPDTAQNCVVEAITEAISRGVMAPAPEDGDAAGMAAWLGAARQMQFGGYLLRYCIDNYEPADGEGAEEEEEEDWVGADDEGY